MSHDESISTRDTWRPSKPGAHSVCHVWCPPLPSQWLQGGPSSPMFRDGRHDVSNVTQSSYLRCAGMRRACICAFETWSRCQCGGCGFRLVWGPCGSEPCEADRESLPPDSLDPHTTSRVSHNPLFAYLQRTPIARTYCFGLKVKQVDHGLTRDVVKEARSRTLQQKQKRKVNNFVCAFAQRNKVAGLHGPCTPELLQIDPGKLVSSLVCAPWPRIQIYPVLG